MKNVLDDRLNKLISDRQARLGRKLSEEEITETRSFAADVIEGATPGLATLLDQVEEAGLLTDDGQLDLETLGALAEAANANGDGDEGELELGEEVSPEEVLAAVQDMDEGELADFLAQNFTEEELDQMNVLAAQGLNPFAQQPRAFSAGYQEPVNVEALIAQAREEARLEAQEIIDNNQRAFAMAQDVQDQGEFVEELVASGRITPHQSGLIHAALIASVSVPDQTRAFAAADLGEFGNHSLTYLLREAFASLPVQPGFQPIYSAPTSQGRSFSAQDFGAINDPAAASRVHEAVRARMQETGENYSAAFAAVKGAL